MSKRNSKIRYDGIDAVDLFCGGGGLTCGLRQTGIDVRMGVDFDGRCEYAYEHNNDFCQNRFWDAKSLLIKFIRRAKKELIVIDAYPGVATLDMLAKRGRGVKIELVTHSNGELEESDFEAFGAQCGKFTKTICGICHGRFIIIDQKEIFWTNASLKDLCRKCFEFTKLDPGEIRCIKRSAFAVGAGAKCVVQVA